MHKQVQDLLHTLLHKQNPVLYEKKVLQAFKQADSSEFSFHALHIMRQFPVSSSPKHWGLFKENYGKFSALAFKADQKVLSFNLVTSLMRWDELGTVLPNVRLFTSDNNSIFLVKSLHNEGLNSVTQWANWVSSWACDIITTLHCAI